jgi:hypothetical protein
MSRIYTLTVPSDGQDYAFLTFSTAEKHPKIIDQLLTFGEDCVKYSVNHQGYFILMSSPAYSFIALRGISVMTPAGPIRSEQEFPGQIDYPGEFKFVR